MKFSIIIPVYKVEKYLDKCLDSVSKQTYKRFEVIIVNDGSPDNSQAIIDKYTAKDKRFKGYIKKNGGLSSARNYGLKYVNGDYLLFLDSDDYIDENLLSTLYNTLSKKKVDLVRYNSIPIDTDGNVLKKVNDPAYEGERIDNIIGELLRRDYVEPAALYCYNVEFWKQHKFTYPEGKLHEDYGLTLLIIYYAKSITSINYNGYYYLQREGSITKTIDYEKMKKGVSDTYILYVNIINTLKSKPKSFKKKAILTYASECMIGKCIVLDKELRREYYKRLRKVKLTRYMYGYNVKKMIKKTVAIISFELYNKLFTDVVK